jgi:hypothetical protein
LGSKSNGSAEAAVVVVVGFRLERAVRGNIVGRSGVSDVNVLEEEIRYAVFEEEGDWWCTVWKALLREIGRGFGRLSRSWIWR